MRRRRKNRSAKVLGATTAIVVAMLGVSVFSLYSLAEVNNSKADVTAAAAKGTATGKLLTEYDAQTDNRVDASKSYYLAEQSDSKVLDTKAAQAADLNEKTAAAQASDIKNIAAKTTAPETVKPVAAETAPVELVVNNAAVESVVEDVYESEDVQTEDYYEASESIELEVVDSYVEPVDDYNEDETYYESDEDADESGEWRYDYDTEEWYYVDYSEVSDESNYDEVSEDYEEVSDYDDDSFEDSEETGEWRYDYDTEEWYYVDYADTSDESCYEETSEYESYVSEEEVYEETEETGEWRYDYDTEEWYYVDFSEQDTYDEPSYEESYEESEDEDYEPSYDDYEESYDEPEESYSPLGQQIVNYAMGFVGVTPYVWSGRSLYGGTDCSGFVNLIYSAFGIYCSPASLAYNGSSFGYIISYDQLQPGDIVVYGGGDHVAIYAGNNMVVHCSSPENGTVFWNMYYRSDLSWFLRVL